MKKIFAFAVAIIATMGISVAAQDSKMYVGGQLGFWHESDGISVNDRSFSTNSLTILPEVGYNLDENWAVGTQIGYSLNHICGAGISSHLFQFNPYARYSFYKSDNGKVSLFVDGGAGIGAGWTHYDSGDESSTAVTWNIGLKPGVAFHPSEKFSIVAHLGLLGYEGANNAAKAGGYKSQGGLLFNANNMGLSFYYNF